MDFSLRSIFKSFSSTPPTTPSLVPSNKSKEASTHISNYPLKLAQLEKRLSASIQYAHGVADGINPLTFISDGVVDAFHLKRLPSLDSREYWSGREDGSKLGMFFDTAGMTAGSALAGASIQCAATTVGGCLPVAGPGAVGGITVMGLSAAMMVGHGKNLESAQQSHEAYVLESDLKTQDAEAKAKIKAHNLEKQDGSHSISRHGPEVSKTQLEERLKTGLTPDGEIQSAPPASTRFKSYQDWIETREIALRSIEKQNHVDLSKPISNGQKTRYEITMEHQKNIGDGFLGSPSSKIKITNPRTGNEIKVFTDTAYENKITRTKTCIEWNHKTLQWEVKQHFPDLFGWDKNTKTYSSSTYFKTNHP